MHRPVVLFPEKKNIVEKMATHFSRALERKSSDESRFHPLKGFS